MQNKQLSKIIALCFTILSTTMLTYAQRFTLEDVPLKWKDFTKRKDFARHPFDAKIYSGIPYSCKFKANGNSTEMLINIELKVNQEKSWVKDGFLDKANDEQSQQLLDHEKGHLIITFIQFKKLKQLFEQQQFSKQQLKTQFDSLYRMVINEIDTLNEAYDNETNHSRIVDKQAEWTSKLLKQLNELYIDDKRLPMEFEVKKSI